MLESNKKSFISKIDKKKAIIGVSVFLVFSVIIWRFVSLAAMEGEQVTDNSAPVGAASVKIKDTGFDGETENSDDPAAIRAYCDDLAFAAQSGGGGKIRDLCILDEVVKTYLPSMTDAEIAKMAEEDPTCLETGFGKDGYNCFTNVDRNGCGRSGLDENGNECTNVNLPKRDDTKDLISVLPENICDIVSGCQSEAEFDVDGFNRFGCNRQGKTADGELCPVEYITRIYDDNNRDQLGFDLLGFNENNCDAQGFNKLGEKCSWEETTRVFNKRGFDQRGFNAAGFNAQNCDINGMNPEGEVCGISDITRIFNEETGLDQFGLDKDGFNENNCDLNGFSRSGELCELSDVTRIYGKDGFDQFGLRRNGRNKFNCDIEGLKPNGDVCKEGELTSFYSPLTGLDQFGFYENGLNIHDCDMLGKKPNGELCSAAEMTRLVSKKTGRDQFGFNSEGKNENGCGIFGFMANGERCELESVTRIFNKETGYDQFGLDKEGFNDKNCNLAGFDKDGNLCDFENIPKIIDPKTGLDQLGFDAEGYNVNNCDINGLDRSGKVCAISDITKVLNPKTGLDQFNLDSDNFDPSTGCNLQGFTRDGLRCDYDDIPKIKGLDGVNQLGFDDKGINGFGCDINGVKEDGTKCSISEMTGSFDEDNMNVFNRDPDGYSRLKFNDLGFNENNCDIDGRKPDGTLCDVDDITPVYDLKTGLDQFGLDSEGFNEYGCNLKGLDKNGARCEEELIPRIFGTDMKDQFGNHISELPESVWVNEKNKKSELFPVLDENGNQVYIDGEPVFSDVNGVLKSEDGVVFRDETGSAIKLGRDGVAYDSSGNKVSVFGKNGEEVTSKLNSESLSLSPLLDQNGNPVLVNGEQAFVDGEGNIRNKSNQLIKDSVGKAMKLNSDGAVINSLGEMVEVESVNGGKVKGPLHSSDKGLSPVLDKDGNPVLINGEPIYQDENGVIKHKNGKVFLDEFGGNLSLGDDGKVKNSRGETVSLTDKDGNEILGPVYSSSNGLEPLLDENGNQVMIDGEPAFVDKKGRVRNVHGDVITDSLGGALTLDSEGKVVDSEGKIVPVTAIGGDAVDSKLESKNVKKSPLLDKNGNQVFIDGKPVWADDKGNVYDAEGNLLKGVDGEPLRLSESGKVIDSYGNEISVTDRNGKSIVGPLSAIGAGLSPLLDEKGNQLMINGEPAFVDENGLVRDASGKIIKDSLGQPLELSDGVVVDSQGNKVETRTLDGKVKNGKVLSLNENDATGLSPLVDENGNQVYVDGEPLFLDKNGNVRNSDGQLAKDKNGNALELTESGEIVNERGQVVPSFTASGARTEGKIKSSSLSSTSEPLLDENGNQVFVDGKPAYLNKDGVVVDEFGVPIKDDLGGVITLSEDGNLKDSVGDLVLGKTASGQSTVGKLSPKNPPLAMEPLLDENGEQIYINGKPAFVDENGVARDANGKVMFDERGGAIKLNDSGYLEDSVGNLIKPMNEDGLAVESMLKRASSFNTPLLGDNGEQIYVNGKKAFVGKDGFLKDENGNLIFDKNGEPLMLSDKGEVVNSKGEKQVVTDLNGDVVEGPLFSKSESTEPLLNAKGESVLVGGQVASVDSLGRLRGPDGEFLLDEFGGVMTLGEDGQVRDSKGNVVTTKTLDGSLNKEPLSAGGLGLSPLLDKNGEPVKVNGKVAFTRADGVVVDENGAPILSKNGLKQTLGVDGVVRDSEGALGDVTSVSGELIDGPLHSSNQGLMPLVGENGEQLYIDGKPAFIDKDGNVKSRNGQLMVGRDGKPLELDENGFVVNSNGEKVAVRDSLGDLYKKPLSTGGMGLSPLLDENGEQVLINGLPAFVDKNGNIKNSDGELIKINGEKLSLNENGEVITDSGKVIEASLKGSGVTGALYADKDANKKTPLVNSNGELMYINGKPVFLDENGNLVDENNNPFKDETGSPLSLNKNGQLVNELGQVKPNEILKNIKGEVSERPFSRGKPLTENEIKAKMAAEELTSIERAKLGLGDDGFNEKGCALTGLNRNGELCDSEDIPRFYNKVTGLDQLGFDDDGFNAYGCNLEGLDRNNQKCRDEYVTRIFDDEGFDQFGINRANLNRAGLTKEGVNILGCDAAGVNCSKEDSPKLTDSLGVDQFGQNEKGQNRLGLINGRNEFGCDLNGLNAQGERCSLEQTPRYMNADGYDQFGLNENLFNKFNCGVDGLKPDGSLCNLNEIPRIFDANQLDQFGLNAQGFNVNGCGLDGYKEDGTLCELSEMTRIFDVDSVDQLGLDEFGYNVNGCDIDGMRADGTLCPLEDVTRVINPDTGFDQFNLDSEGFNASGCDLNGRNREGDLCSVEDIPRIFDENGIDQLGLNKKGRNSFGCDLYGYDEKGNLCPTSKMTKIYDTKGVDQFGIDKKTKLNKNGCDINGLKPNGKRCKPSSTVRFIDENGLDQDKFDESGFNFSGCDINGFDVNGNRCDVEDITRVIDKETGLDQLGLDEKSLNEHGCGIDGLREDGTACAPDQLTHWFDSKGLTDQFGLSEDGFNENECNLLGFKKDGTRCDYDKMPNIIGVDGRNQVGLDSSGFGENGLTLSGYDRDGCNELNMREDGTRCSMYVDIPLTPKDAVYMDAHKASINTWVASVKATEEAALANVKPTTWTEPEKRSQAVDSTASLGNIDKVSGVDGLETSADTADEKENLFKKIQIPAGYMTAIYVKQAVNSDYTQDVYAEITMGELAPATLIGKIVVPYVDDPVMPRDMFYYEFTSMIYKRQRIAIDAVTINMSNDSGMVEADDVDYHRVQRYGGLIFASAIQALDATFLDSQAEKDAQAQADAIGEAANQALVYGANTRELTKQNMQVATDYVSDLATQQFFRRPTVKKGAGPQMLIFRTEVQDERLPMVLMGLN